MSARQYGVAAFLLQFVLYLCIVLFALYQFKRHTTPQPIFFTNAENALKAGNEAAARNDFDEALRKRPKDPTAYGNVIDTCILQNKTTLAIEYTQRAIEACKQQPAEIRSALFRTLSGEYSQVDQAPHQQRAIEAAKKALDLAPDNHIMENEYGFLLADNAPGRGPDVDTALVVLKRALDGIKKGPVSPYEEQLGPIFAAETEDSYGWALYKNEQYADAVTALTQALDDYPENAPGELRKVFYYHLGMAFSKLGRMDQAENAFHSALAYDAKYEDAIKALSNISPIVTKRPAPIVQAFSPQDKKK